jgi:hypothetical protein
MDNFKQIPIVLNNFNRVTLLKGMINDLQNRGYRNIHILDNQSTYPPLLQFYKELQEGNQVTIKYLDRNYIQNALWDCGYNLQFCGRYNWIVYSDSDLELNGLLPENFIDTLINKATQWGFKKAGFALKIDDLPDTLWGNTNREWEAKYWVDKLEENVYNAKIDTTFAVIRPGDGLLFDAIRLAGDFTARHIPWYLDLTNLDNVEEKYYLAQSHDYSTSARFYREHYKNR